MKPYQIALETLLASLRTNTTTGLSEKEAADRLVQYGANEVPEKKTDPWILVFIYQFASPLIYILLAAAALIFFLSDDKRDAFIILGILTFNAIIGTIQEGRTQSILSGLKQLLPSDCVVLRDGKRVLIKKADLVPGDILLIQEGQRIPADARLIEGHGIRIDEAMLTGESKPIDKYEEMLSGHEIPVAEQRNMVFKGTYVLSGFGTAVVTGTGLNTQLGEIHLSAQEIVTEVPLRKELDRLASVILIFILAVCAALFGMGLLGGLPISELLVTLTALFICVVPEGLPVVLTLVLFSGVYRMAKQRVLVKNIQAVEGLGRTQVIVIDKTGTLTRNEMIVSQVYADEQMWTISGKGYFAEGQIFAQGKTVQAIDKDSQMHAMAQAAYLLNHADITFIAQRGVFDIKGDPTEAALSVFAQKLAIADTLTSYELVYEIPFTPELKFHAGFYRIGSEIRLYVIGSPEAVRARTTTYPLGLPDALEQSLLQGLRILVAATKVFKTLPAMPNDHQEKRVKYIELIQDLELIGFYGIEDSLRTEVAYVIRQARNAGLRIIMATGDHMKTAVYVAQAVGIYKEGDEVIEGPELATLSGDALYQRMKDVTVCARVSPTDKVKIISQLHEQGLIVAMTGDGINDVPALVAADIGIGMGGIGTEVAKEASDIILLDDSFAHIIQAIKQGRHIFYTLRRVILYFFATNMGEILIILLAFLYNLSATHTLPLPLTAAQILWLNLITDGFLDVALSMELEEPDVLSHQEWLKGNMRLIDRSLLIAMMFAAVPMALGSLGIFMLVYPYDLTLARTMTLVSMACFQWFNAWNCRSEIHSVFSRGFTTNKWLILATSFVLLLQVSLLHVPFLQNLFGTCPLTLAQWVFIVIIASSIIWVEEVRKYVLRRWWPVA